MSLAHLIRNALAMPPRQAADKALRYVGRRVRNRLIGRLMRNQCTYPAISQLGGGLSPRLAPVDPAALAANAEALRKLAQATRAHRFDLLGSGWVKVAHGERYNGFGGHRYGPGPGLKGGDWRNTVAAGHWRGNQAHSRYLLSLIEDETYQPIDWQVDFISGYRWSVRDFGSSVPYGHRPGVDIKVPWELARLQHLVPLALAYALDRDQALVAEFRHQVLDFLGSNPPGWGVNWACAMDVAIRAVNMLVAWDLFKAHGAAFDEEFEDELAAAMLAHARHIAGNLEWNQGHRGNHYLADICGLAWIAAYLPRSDEADIFLVLAVQQLGLEIERQFGPDGANFEASTVYHRLSAEMALYTVALVLGLPEDRRAALAAYDHKLWRRHPPLAPAPMAWPPFGEAVMERLARAARFAADITKPSGEVVQVGDNDSGRFLKLAPRFDAAMRERGLDFGHLAAAAKGLFNLDLQSPPVAAVETVIVAQLAGGHRLAPATEPARSVIGAEPPGTEATRVTRVVIVPQDPSALAGLEAAAYPEFGLFVWKAPRAFISVRCGPIGQNGTGAHAHNDQLAVEIEIDREPWARDPGSFVYTPDLAARNAYRSALAHFVPRSGADEPATLLAPFKLEDRAQARALRFDGGVFLGTHQGFATPVWRRVLVGDGAVVIEDCWGGPVIGRNTAVEEQAVRRPDELVALWGLTVPFSPGYGLRSRSA